MSGTLEADGSTTQSRESRRSGFYPKEVDEHVHKERRLFRGQDGALLPHVTRQLSILLSSGVPLLEALNSLSEENKGTWKTLLIRSKSGWPGGRAFPAPWKKTGPSSRFLRQHGRGRRSSGTLDTVLARVADSSRKQERIRGKVRMAMVYPTFMIWWGLS